MPVAASEYELPIRASFHFEFVESLNQTHMVLSGMLQAGDIQKERLVQPQMVFHEHLSLFLGAGKEPFVVYAIINDCDALLTDSEECFQIMSRVLADRYELILPARQSFRHDPPIEHPFPIVFSRDMKWRQIMNSSDQWARTPPQ